jgi:hypothetical protein
MLQSKTIGAIVAILATVLIGLALYNMSGSVATALAYTAIAVIVVILLDALTGLISMVLGAGKDLIMMAAMSLYQRWQNRRAK